MPNTSFVLGIFLYLCISSYAAAQAALLIKVFAFSFLLPPTTSSTVHKTKLHRTLPDVVAQVVLNAFE